MCLGKNLIRLSIIISLPTALHDVGCADEDRLVEGGRYRQATIWFTEMCLRLR